MFWICDQKIFKIFIWIKIESTLHDPISKLKKWIEQSQSRFYFLKLDQARSYSALPAHIIWNFQNPELKNDQNSFFIKKSKSTTFLQNFDAQLLTHDFEILEVTSKK